jgi:hypothetical protein
LILGNGVIKDSVKIQYEGKSPGSSFHREKTTYGKAFGNLPNIFTTKNRRSITERGRFAKRKVIPPPRAFAKSGTGTLNDLTGLDEVGAGVAVIGRT